MKNKSFSKLFILISAIVIVAMALLFLEVYKNNKYLNIYNENGDRLANHKILKDGTFSVSFIHSVNKSPVTDYYKIINNDIYLYKTVYYNFGAGVPTDITGDESLTYGEDGSMIIDNINKKIDSLSFFLSEQSDHILTIENEAFSLWNECGKNMKINIKIEG